MPCWPPQVLFLNEVEEILEMVQSQQFQVIMVPLFDRIALCVGSPHFQVAERALFLWNNEYIVSLIASSREAVLPRVFEALYTNSRNHWNSTVHGLTCNVVKLFMEMDSTLFDKCSQEYREKSEKEEKEKQKSEDEWKEMEKKCEAKPNYNEVKIYLNQESLAYSMRSSVPKLDGDLSALTAGMEGMSFGQQPSKQPTTDALKRKSTLPTKK
jgi:serine/threonine-protein phosphatase 2A regulatory subunit B'